MKDYRGYTGLILIALMLAGCGVNSNEARQQSVDTVSAPFASGAITLNLRAEPGLNRVNEMPNSCTVLLIQAKDKPSLDKVLNNSVLLKGLFAGAGSEGNILQLDRYVMMPGQTNILHIDRAQNTRNIALVAGYYPFPVKQHMLIAEIPVETQSSSWWSPVWQSRLAPVTLSVTLGSESIVNVETSKKTESVTPKTPSVQLNAPAMVEEKE
ncbi:type VI secretion lipoprotein TssJ [Enterobacter bugandensis]